MSLKEIDIREAYETEKDRFNLVDQFYIPALEQTKHYCRITGFFSSASLVIAAEGIEGLIANDGDMKLLVSPHLTESDKKMICRLGTLDETADLYKDLAFSDTISDNEQALAWMLANKKLEVRIVVPRSQEDEDALFHEKVGIMEDSDGHRMSFSGSINETAAGWLKHVEEFKVFKEWIDGQKTYFDSDLKKFTNYWSGERKDMVRIFTLPDAIKDRIISISPDDPEELRLMKKYRQKKAIKTTISLFPHQQEAVSAWEDNNGRILIEMATGTGKTRTAIACMQEAMNLQKKGLFIVIATPQVMLSQQWKDSVSDLHIRADREFFADGSNADKYTDISGALYDIRSGMARTAIVYTTHTTSCGQEFINAIIRAKEFVRTMFICDEVHGAASEQQKQAFLDIYDFRIGLSATPERMYDEEGTSLIRSYFGGRSYSFDIASALHTINPLTGKPFLNEYEYYPIFVPLTAEEQNAYNGLTRQIIAAINAKEKDEKRINMLKIKRANILKDAELKISTYSQLIDELGASLTDTITFTSPKQMKNALSVLAEKGISRAKITEKESANAKLSAHELSERQQILSDFKDHNIQMLLGIKCMDEGIDIPNAHTAILMASSTNPREFIQRVGRVIRPAKGKPVSRIYDMIVLPGEGAASDAILEKEAKRAAQIAVNAKNYDDVKEAFKRKGVIIDVY